MKRDRKFHPPWQHIKSHFGWSWWALFYLYRNTDAEQFLIEKNQGTELLIDGLGWRA